MQVRATLSRLQALFATTGLVVHVIFPREGYRTLVFGGQFWDASVLRRDLPIALATNGREDLRVGLIVNPSSRGCSYPSDANLTFPCSMSTIAYIALATTEVVHRGHKDKHNKTQPRGEKTQCCQLDWEAAFAAKARLATGRDPSLRARFNQHNRVRVAWSPTDVLAVFYKVYKGETAGSSKQVRQACAEAKRVQTILHRLWNVSDSDNTSTATRVEVVRVQLPGDNTTRACKGSSCWSNVDWFYPARLTERRVVQLVFPSEC